jgi:pSer/pThr/pTyr-binding forkhead associated (FHA) protein
VAKLVIFRGENVENETRLAGRPVRLGRDNRNDIVLDDKSVSRFHAEVRSDGDKYVIVDLKSRNGVWVNGQQVKGKTALALGAPVTLGAFEVTLEDDVPTGEFDEESPLLEPRGTMVNTPTDQSQGGSRSATRPSMKAPAATTERRMVLWGAAALAVLLIVGVAFAVIQYRRPAAATVEVLTPPPVPDSPAPPTVIAEPPPAEDPTKVTIDRHLTEGQASLAKGDYAAAREHVREVLELEAGNQAAVDLRRKVDAAAAASSRGKAPVVAVAPPPPPPPVATEVETPGIPRRTGEAWTDYTARAQGIRANLDAGRAYLAKNEFPLGLARLRAVSAAQKGYLNVEALITEAETKQRTAFDQAMKYGQDSEKQSPPRWSDALKWYLSAQAIDPSATAPREKIGPLTDRVTKEGMGAFDRAEVFRKRGDNAKAIENYKVAADVLPQNNEKRAEAVKWLETLKP